VNLAEQPRANRLVAIVRGTDREAALQSVLALVDAGIGMVEVSLTTPDADVVIAQNWLGD
jgi:2-dehydro-3-deoxyphosphogluconate aldolase/(4S)-4-hydroxy-2-oxoglutarate aldolase